MRYNGIFAVCCYFRRLYYEVGRRRMKETLMGAKNNCLLPFFKNSVVENYGPELLNELDKGERAFPENLRVF